MTTSEPVLADWNTALYRLLHPAQIAIVEAHLWIGRPLSARALQRVLSGGWAPSTISYHVRHLAAAGVLGELYTSPVRGGAERHYGLARP